MKKIALFASAAAMLIAGPTFAQTPGSGGKPRVPSVAELAAYPKIANVRVSPDGKHLVALEGRGEDRVILVWRTDALDQAPTVIGSTQMKITSVQFIKNDMLAVSMFQPYDYRGERVIKSFLSKLYVTDLEGKNWREPITLPVAKSDAEEEAQATSSPQVLSTLPNDPDNILVVNSVGSNAGDVFRVNVRNGRTERVQRSEENVASYEVDAQGNLRARLRYDVDGGGSYVAVQFREPNGNWSQHFKSYRKARDVTDVVGFTEDPNIAIIASNVGQDRSTLFEYDIAARKLGEPLFKHRFFEATGVVTWRYANTPGVRLGEIIGVSYDGPRENEVTFTAPRLKAINDAIRSAMHIEVQPITFIDTATGTTAVSKYDTGLTADIQSYSADLNTVVFSTSSPDLPPTFYMLRDGKLTTLGRSQPTFDNGALGTTSFVYYKARDGRVIPAFLTKPSEALCGPGPWRAVVHPHGGPWSRDEMRYDGFNWISLMSTRCMAVLRPQYRGSTNWGRSLWKAGDAQWGLSMQDDKDDGAKWMIDNKVAIPGRIAMFGFSYGGYSAMVAAIRPNGLYRCAIAGAGVGDIKRSFRNLETNPFFRDGQKFAIDGLNPVDRAAGITIPIMVYQGDRDQTVPQIQSEVYVAQARKSSQPVEYHLLKDFAHGPAWTRAVNAQQLQLIDDYFAKGCGGAGL